VLFSMIAGPLLIRYNHALALRLAPARRPGVPPVRRPACRRRPAGRPRAAGGYGRVGQSLGHFLEAEGIAYAALDLDADRVREARLAGERVHYGDSAQIELLEALGLARRHLVVITHDDTAAAVQDAAADPRRHPALPVMVRTRDQSAWTSCVRPAPPKSSPRRWRPA
jgi:monovalent cation:H+ antiporter-2, CPA2 family